MTKLQVKAKLPRNAHARMPEDTPTVTISEHTPTVRGIRNALDSYQDVVTDYVTCRGNMAAFRVWIEYKGETLMLSLLRDMTLFPDWSEFEAQYCDLWNCNQVAQAEIDRQAQLEYDKMIG